MDQPLAIDVVTIFPGMLSGFLDESILKRASAKGRVRFRTINLRDFASDNHRSLDDRSFGGGPGMVMMPEPVFDAVETVATPGARVVLMTPQGRPFEQSMARALALERHLIFVCGHYEGVDERIRTNLATDEISIGDYVLTNGVLPAAVVIDAVVRLVPGVLGNEDGCREESFSGPMLEYPQYTRPAEFRGLRVPDVLMSGNHADIRRWRDEQAELRTQARRPDLLGSGRAESR